MSLLKVINVQTPQATSRLTTAFRKARNALYLPMRTKMAAYQDTAVKQVDEYNTNKLFNPNFDFLRGVADFDQAIYRELRE